VAFDWVVWKDWEERARVAVDARRGDVLAFETARRRANMEIAIA